MLRILVTAAAVLLPLWAQEMPVTRLAGAGAREGATQAAPQPAATPPAGRLPPRPVTRHRVETRQFDVNVLHLQRGLQRSTGAGGGATSITSSMPVEDAFESIGAGVASLLSNTGRMHIDRRAGLATI